MNWFYYLPIIILFIASFILVYTRIQYDRFWIHQPIFHKYNISYYFSSPQIINTESPIKNEYTNFTNIETFSLNELDEIWWNRFLSTILKKTNKLLDKRDVSIYFETVLERSYISFYNEAVVYQNIDKGYYIDEKKTVGVITSRPLRFFISKLNSELPIYYIDYLNVDKIKNEEKQITYELIQTHIYNQQLLNKQKLKTSKKSVDIETNKNYNIKICLFKRHNIKNNIGVVPLCAYKSYLFSYKQYYFKKYIYENYHLINNKFKHFKIFKLSKLNFNTILEFMKGQHSERFTIFILPDINNLYQQIISEKLIVYYLLDVINGQIIAVYFFRTYNQTVSCVGSICYYKQRENISYEDYYLYGFKDCVLRFTEKKALLDSGVNSGKLKKGELKREKTEWVYFHIENISDNTILIKDLIKMNANKSFLRFITTDTMYFFYNFIHPKCDSKDVFILY
jgi:hypothetical protein